MMLGEPVPEPGDLLLVGAAASVQFGGDRALVVRVISVSDKPTYDGWAWLTAYVLDQHGQAVDKREIFVQLAGRRPTSLAPPKRSRRR